jgi:N-dimethylarginine dimethylaminohydrolase
MNNKELVDRMKGKKPEEAQDADKEPVEAPEEDSGEGEKSTAYDKVVPTEKAKTPSDLRWPTFCMVAPFEHSFNAAVKNNVWMKETDEPINYDKAYSQWCELYHFLAGNSLVYLIPNYGRHQDLIYVANMGIYLEPNDLIVMSNFTSEPRRGEEDEGREMFEAMKYKVVDPPKDIHFEGEADLKFIRDNIYSGGYGIRSDKETYEWMEKEFDIKITKCLMTSEKNYHYDCMFNPLTTQTALACTSIFQPKDLKQLEKVVDLVDIPEKEAEAMACNIVRVGSTVMVCSSISEMKETDDAYEIESAKIARLNKACIKNGLGLVVFNLSEFDKSGAALSCNIMHLNFTDYQEPNAEVF